MSNIPVVQSIYQAFGRGDNPAILERLHPDVEWEYDSVEHGIPWLIPRRGRAERVKFFESLQGVESASSLKSYSSKWSGRSRA